MVFISYPKVDQIDFKSAPNRIIAQFVKAEIISLIVPNYVIQRFSAAFVSYGCNVQSCVQLLQKHYILLIASKSF